MAFSSVSCMHRFSGMVSPFQKGRHLRKGSIPDTLHFFPQWNQPPNCPSQPSTILFFVTFKADIYCNLNKTLQINMAHLCVPNWLETWCRRKWDVIWNVYSHGALFILFYFSQPRTICWLLLFPVRISQGELFCFLTLSGSFPVCPLIWRLALQNSSIKQDTGSDKTTLSWWWWWHCLSLPFNKCLLSSAQPGTYLSSSISRYYLLSVCHRRAPSLLLYVCFSV